MIPIEAGSPFTPIGETPSNNATPVLLIVTITIIATSLIIFKTNDILSSDKKG